MTNTIFVFLQEKSREWYVPMAIAEDGTCLGSHISSSEAWAWHDIGLTSDWKHEIYREKYPAGYELVRVDSPLEHPGLMEAYRKNQAMAKQEMGAIAAEAAPYDETCSCCSSTSKEAAQ